MRTPSFGKTRRAYGEMLTFGVRSRNACGARLFLFVEAQMKVRTMAGNRTRARRSVKSRQVRPLWPRDVPHKEVKRGNFSSCLQDSGTMIIGWRVRRLTVLMFKEDIPGERIQLFSLSHCFRRSF